MTKFKVGDKVRVLSNVYDTSYRGRQAIVKQINPNLKYGTLVEFTGGESVLSTGILMRFCYDELELIEKWRDGMVR